MTSETKQCTKCGVVKPATLEYFVKYSRNKSTGLQSQCKECNKAYRKANKEAIAEQRKAYRKANKEAIAEQKKTYYKANKEVIAEQHKAYYKANKEAIAEKKKAYREANKEAIAEQKKAYYRTPKGKWRHIKKGAKERNINFSLHFDLYESQLWGKPCHYCGCVLEVTGLDRKDSNKGYIPDNVVPCCYDCNTKKGTKPYEEFIAEVKNER